MYKEEFAADKKHFLILFFFAVFLLHIFQTKCETLSNCIWWDMKYWRFSQNATHVNAQNVIKSTSAMCVHGGWCKKKKETETNVFDLEIEIFNQKSYITHTHTHAYTEHFNTRKSFSYMFSLFAFWFFPSLQWATPGSYAGKIYAETQIFPIHFNRIKVISLQNRKYQITMMMMMISTPELVISRNV